jgi:hypothetical protein
MVPEFSLYNNATAFLDPMGNIVIVLIKTLPTLLPDVAVYGMQVWIHVIGRCPELWPESFPLIANLGIRELQCPICVKDGEPTEVLASSESVDSNRSCAMGHTLLPGGMTEYSIPTKK